MDQDKPTFVDAENAMPKVVLILRHCEGARIPQCYYEVEIHAGKRKVYRGIISTWAVLGLLKRYHPYKNHPKWVFPFKLFNFLRKKQT